jgi:hypothetical protein
MRARAVMGAGVSRMTVVDDASSLDALAVREHTHTLIPALALLCFVSAFADADHHWLLWRRYSSRIRRT